MTRLAMDFVIEIDQMLVERDVLGRSIVVRRGEDSWRIDLPEGPGSFPYMRATLSGEQADPRDYDPKAVIEKGSESYVEVRLLQLIVEFEGGLSAETFDPEGHNAEFRRIVYGYEAKALEIAAEFSARLRLEAGQPWVEPTGQFPRRLSPLQLADVEAGVYFRTMIAMGGRVRVLGPENVLSAESLQGLQASMAKGPLHPDESLLSEAEYLADGDQQGAAERATLLAAIAVELRTKRFLREVATNPDALELLLENPRDWSMAAHGLYLKAVPVFLGRDLGARHKDSAKGVQHLFTARNKIAHKGEPVTQEAAVQHVQVAVEVFSVLAQALTGPVE